MGKNCTKNTEPFTAGPAQRARDGRQTTDDSHSSRQVGAALCSKARRRSPSHKRRGTSAVQGSLSPPACGPTGSTPRVNHRRPPAWYPVAAHRPESPQPARPGERATPRGRTPASQSSARGRRAAPRGVAPLTPRALNRVPQPPRAEGACKETGKQRLASEGPRSAQRRGAAHPLTMAKAAHRAQPSPQRWLATRANRPPNAGTGLPSR